MHQGCVKVTDWRLQSWYVMTAHISRLSEMACDVYVWEFQAVSPP